MIRIFLGIIVQKKIQKKNPDFSCRVKIEKIGASMWEKNLFFFLSLQRISKLALKRPSKNWKKPSIFSHFFSYYVRIYQKSDVESLINWWFWVLNISVTDFATIHPLIKLQFVTTAPSNNKVNFEQKQLTKTVYYICKYYKSELWVKARGK